MRTRGRFSAVAMEFASEVLPTPGGPEKQRIAPAPFFCAIPRRERSSLTAKYSTMRFLGF